MRGTASGIVGFGHAEVVRTVGLISLGLRDSLGRRAGEEGIPVVVDGEGVGMSIFKVTMPGVKTFRAVFDTRSVAPV